MPLRVMIAIRLRKVYLELAYFLFTNCSVSQDELKANECEKALATPSLKCRLFYLAFTALINFAFVFNLIEVLGLTMIGTFDIVLHGGKTPD